MMQNGLKCEPMMLFDDDLSGQLYFVSDRELAEGDAYMSCGPNVKPKVLRGWKEPKRGDVMSPYWDVKIEASTDLRLSLPWIPKEWIRKYWEPSPSNCEIKHVYLALKDDGSGEPRKEGRGGKRYVVVLPTKDCFTVEELKIEMYKAWVEGAATERDEGGMFPYPNEFDRWFNRNY